MVVLRSVAVLLRRPAAGLNEEVSDLDILVLVRSVVPLDAPCAVWNLSGPVLCLEPYQVFFSPAPGAGLSPGS